MPQLLVRNSSRPAESSRPQTAECGRSLGAFRPLSAGHSQSKPDAGSPNVIRFPLLSGSQQARRTIVVPANWGCTEPSISAAVKRGGSVAGSFPRAFYDCPPHCLPSFSSFSETLGAVARELLHLSGSNSTSPIVLPQRMDSPCSHLSSSSPLELWDPPFSPCSICSRTWFQR